MDCMENNTEFTVKGDNFEAKQVEPSKKAVNAYQGYLSAIRNDKNILEVALLTSEKETATEERQKEIDDKIIELSSFVSDGQESMNNAFNVLIEGTLKGPFLGAGYCRVEGKDKEIDIDLIEGLPTKLYEVLKDNAIKLITTTEAIEGN